jgi:hypothetical protein
MDIVELEQPQRLSLVIGPGDLMTVMVGAVVVAVMTLGDWSKALMNVKQG